MNDAASSSDSSPDLLARLRHLTQPLVDSLDARLRDQIDRRVDARVDASLSARLSVIERAIADLDRSLTELRQRVEPD